MYFIVTDLEATCDQPQLPFNEREPIEIGAVAVNEQLEIVSSFETFIRPTIHTQLSDFCMQLTSIKQSDVLDAPVFKTAYTRFEDWFIQFDNPVFCSWGNYDFRELDRMCKLNNMKFHFSEDQFYNLKELFAKKQNISRGIGLGKAFNYARLTFEGTKHRGIDDARNIARLIKYSYYDNKINNNK